MSTKKAKPSAAQVIEKALEDADKKASVETVTPVADKKAPKEKETVAKPTENEVLAKTVEPKPGEKTEAPKKPAKTEIVAVEGKDTVLNAAASSSVEKVKSKPKKEEVVVSNEIDLSQPVKKKIKDSLLIIDDQVVELKPVGQLVGLLGFVNEYPVMTPIDLANAKHVILKDMLFILNNGSSVTISDVNLNDDNVRYAKAGDFSVGSLPIVVLNDSKLVTTYWPRIKGKNKLFSSNVSGNGDLFADISLEDVDVSNSHIRSGHITLTRVSIRNSNIQAPNTSLSDTWIKDTSVNTKGICRISDFNVQKSLNLYGYSAVEIAPNHPLYEPDLKISSLYNRGEEQKVVLTIVSRVDYGHFNAVKPLEFTRCNTADIVVSGVYLNNDEFEQVYKRYSSDLGQHTGGNYFNGGLGNGGVACECLTEEKYLKLVRSLYSLAMGKMDETYKPDRSNTLENGIIMNLLEQIRSRMNLYKQVNSVVN